MEVGAHVWLRSEKSHWGWVPAKITRKEDSFVGKVPVINLTLTNDVDFVSTDGFSPSKANHKFHQSLREYFGDQERFEKIVTVDPEQLKTADHEDIKLRNLSRSYQLKEDNNSHLNNKSGFLSPVANHSSNDDDTVVGGVDDLIGLTHLHEPAILHALRLRYDSDIIYTSTGPILIAINPFKDMPLYSEAVMERYRLQGEDGTNAGAGGNKAVMQATTPFKRRTNDALIRKMNGNKKERLPPHAYQTADDAYRAMMRGMENDLLLKGNNGPDPMPTNQSILVSGESGAGKTVTTKIVLNYLAMLSRKACIQSHSSSLETTFRSPEKRMHNDSSDSSSSTIDEDGNIESHVLQSNPILESFGNARTIRNDNSSRFGKYIDIRFTPSGRLTGASIETYLLEKVRLIHPSRNERNYHVFYQFLSGASERQKDEFYLTGMSPRHFVLLNQTGTYDRRDGVSDRENHKLMIQAMVRFTTLHRDFTNFGFIVLIFFSCFWSSLFSVISDLNKKQLIP